PGLTPPSPEQWNASYAALQRDRRIIRGVAMVRLQHHNDGADLYPVVKVDGVLVGHADAARRNRGADIFRLVGAVDAEQRILAVGIEVHRPRAHRVVGARRHIARHAQPLDLARGRVPGRPLRHGADLGDAGPGHRLFAHGDAVADRLATIEHV